MGKHNEAKAIDQLLSIFNNSVETALSEKPYGRGQIAVAELAEAAISSARETRELSAGDKGLLTSDQTAEISNGLWSLFDLSANYEPRPLGSVESRIQEAKLMQIAPAAMAEIRSWKFTR